LLFTKYYSGDQIKKSEMGRACGKYGGHEKCIHGLTGRPERKRPLGRPKRRREDNIKMDLQEVGWRSMDWVDQAQDRGRWQSLVNAVKNLRVP
jgi:hypothetical protein